MLLGNIGVDVSQQEITEAAGATHTIETHGTRVDQLARAVQGLVPIARLWYKEKASLDDIFYVLEEAKYPVGVDGRDCSRIWTMTTRTTDTTVLSPTSKRPGELIIVDPYKDYVDQNRIIKISTFLERWWDFNEVMDPQTGETTFKKDEQLFFVAVPLAVSFPAELGMQSYY